MAFLMLQENNMYIVHGDTLVISDRTGTPTVLQNPVFQTASSDSKTSQEEEEEEEDDDGSKEEVQDGKKDAVDCSQKVRDQIVINKEALENLCENLEDCEETSGSPDKKEIDQNNDPRAVCCCLSACGNFLAVGDHAKRLIIWQHEQNNKWNIRSTRTTKRKCIRLSFGRTSQVVFAADRAGDVYSYSLSEPQEPGKLLLGHLSMLLDMVVSYDEKYIITSDRDEKIRVSHYPNTYNIHCYCLGHTEFVSTLSLYKSGSDWLLSGSGDCTLRVWNYETGNQLCSHSYIPDIEVALNNSSDSETRRKSPAASQIEIAEETGLLAVSFDKVPCVGLYQLDTSMALPAIKHRQLVVCSAEPWDMKLSTNSQKLFILSPTEEEILRVLQTSEDKLQSKVIYLKQLPNEDNREVTQLQCLLNTQWNTLKDCKRRDDFQHLYKQWFDNVKVYLEKKKLRENEKQNKSKKKFKK